MNNLVRNNSSLVIAQLSLLGLALMVTFSFSFIGEGFAKEAAVKPPYYSVEGVPTALTVAEKKELIENINTNGVIEVVEMPMTIRILDQEGQMVYEASGKDVYLMEDDQLQELIDKSNMLFESDNVYFYMLD